jgi:hypothetical protein
MIDYTRQRNQCTARVPEQKRLEKDRNGHLIFKCPFLSSFSIKWVYSVASLSSLFHFLDFALNSLIPEFFYFLDELAKNDVKLFRFAILRSE